MKDNDLVYDFLYYLRVLAPDILKPRSKAHPDGELQPLDGRDISLDAAWPTSKVAVEIDGGNWMVRRAKRGNYIPVGRHTKDEDYEKLNLLVLAGWRVLRFTPAMLKKDPAQCIAQVVELLDKGKGA